VKTMSVARRSAIIISALGFLVPLLRAQAGNVPRAAALRETDFASAYREIVGFEAVLNSVIGESFPNPFSLVNKAKGVYLPGYGEVFSFLINVQRAAITTPWGEVGSGRALTPADKKQQIEGFKDRLVRLLLAHAGDLNQLRPEESITIAALFEDRNFPDLERQNRTVVLSVLKKDLDEWSGKPDRWKEFKQRMRIIEY